MEPLVDLTLPNLSIYKTGKVRVMVHIGADELGMVATDRISAFDAILPTGIPGKGKILTEISTYWFQKTQHIVPNHYISMDWSDFPVTWAPFQNMLAGRTIRVKKTTLIEVECVVRGYLFGSIWPEYQQKQTACGIPLPPGLELAEKLPSPIFTPAIKARSGHDENMSYGQLTELVGETIAERLSEISIVLYEFAASELASKGIILADTKFEFGIVGDTLMLIDELLTPDSSRYWPKVSYAVGQSPPSLDKQFIRDYLRKIGWDPATPPPSLPQSIVDQTAAIYGNIRDKILF